MMEWALTSDGKRTKRPTKIGEETGISVEERMGNNGPYQVVVYNNDAQHFIIDNLDAILTAENMQTEMQGAPWAKEHDDCLVDLYKKSVPVSEIAVTLKRSTSAVRGRLKNLDLTHSLLYDVARRNRYVLNSLPGVWKFNFRQS